MHKKPLGGHKVPPPPGLNRVNAYIVILFQKISNVLINTFFMKIVIS